MGECNTNFKPSDGSEIPFIYQVLVDNGVACDALDQGYPVLIDSDNIAGPSADDKAEIQGVRNGVIEGGEVVGYFLDHYELYKDLISSNVSNSWIGANFRNRGLLSNFMDERDKAIGYCTEAIKINPNDAEAYFNRGVAWAEKGDLAEAIANFTEAIRMNPKNANAYYNRGNAWREKGDFNRAIADFTQALSIDPRLAEAYNGRGVAWSDKGELDKAIADFTEAIRINPKYIEAYYGRGLTWTKKGDIDKAIADFTGTIRLNPENVDAYNNRGSILIEKGDFDKAIIDYTEAIRLNPNNAVAYYNRGLAWIKKGDIDKAIIDFTTAVKLNPTDFFAHANLGFALVKNGELDKAIQPLAQFLRLSPQGPDILPNVSSSVSTRWNQNADTKQIATNFESETGGLDIAKVEALFICSYSYWEAEQKDKAREILTQIDGALTFKTPPSPSTKEFFTQMFNLMPKTMSQDAELQATIKSLVGKCL